MIDKDELRERHFEVTYVLGRVLNEHLIRTFRAFDGDITAAIVLGTIGQYNYRRYFDSIAKGDGTFHERVERGEHLANISHCNALSISESTGIPRETVRRKIRLLIEKGWVKQIGRDKLMVTDVPALHFKEFNLETMEWFCDAAEDVLRLAGRHQRR